MMSSGLPENISDDEKLARFLFSKSWFNSQGVKPAAFLPSNDRETSTFRHGSEPRDVLWAIGATILPDGRSIHGAAIVQAGDVRAVSLEILATEPPPRHACIRGWPWSEEDPDMQKAKHKNLATQLAAKAELVVP